MIKVCMELALVEKWRWSLGDKKMGGRTNRNVQHDKLIHVTNAHKHHMDKQNHDN